MRIAALVALVLSVMSIGCRWTSEPSVPDAPVPSSDAVPVVDGVPTADSDSDETPPFSARFCTRNGLPRGNVRGPAYGS